MSLPGDYNGDLARTGVMLLPSGRHARGYGWERDTRAALAWLTPRVHAGDRVLDVGTGTGILAIHAAKLGARVVAYEADPAVRAIAEQNAAANDVRIDLRGEYDGEGGFEIVVANLGAVDYDALGVTAAGRQIWTTP